ncbi:uncharacterized protein [Rutidosis leptorrhynchoides]|uniref:uncharacterized protein n=1 Tax=Rutidosis leptorrhynchoides TaxID=125765 RepID=UPI003A9915EF
MKIEAMKLKLNSGILNKIDKVMANDVFFAKFVSSYAGFQPYRASDHTPAILKLPDVEGHRMYKVVKKLCMLKKPVRKIMWQKGNLHEHVMKLRMELDAAQLSLYLNPFSIDICGNEAHLLQAYNGALLDEERFLKQKAKVEWLRVGDNNSRYSNNVVNSKINKSRIQVVMDVDGNMNDGNEVPNMFVNHYATFLGTATVSTPIHDPDSLFTRKVSNEKDLVMINGLG